MKRIKKKNFNKAPFLFLALMLMLMPFNLSFGAAAEDELMLDECRVVEEITSQSGELAIIMSTKGSVHIHSSSCMGYYIRICSPAFGDKCTLGWICSGGGNHSEMVYGLICSQ